MREKTLPVCVEAYVIYNVWFLTMLSDGIDSCEWKCVGFNNINIYK